MFIATLIAAHLPEGEVSAAYDRLDAAGCLPVATVWLEAGEACDLQFGRDMVAARTALEGHGYDVVVQSAEHRRKKLIVADMDSTMITVECIDELADYAGIKAEVALVTEAAMRGEMDFGEALDARVALLRGMDEGVIDRCLAERVEITSGARELVRTMRANGATAILVSGGFTRFAEPVAREIGFDRAIANVLEVTDGKLTGTVTKPIVDSATKLATLSEAMLDLRLMREETLAVGDGANDLAMITQAGLGVAYHAKPVVAQAAGARIDHGDLSALLFAQGYARKDWVTA
ncbi:phosphoserine phosphatase SerB [Sphingomonas panacisoli]|uniref:Phosphoserine phosphatase n=1 Tax=Sphingomonas panacisoli TaxID=1813879 RepID=A0A5B8LH86_9SPHN|nr:phosphoserine phosphatase SerB [Sphingomonas panacisoli]QDZ07381.1 phosphoserine phosphatase SerB [Sphingomonas panacisoli]